MVGGECPDLGQLERLLLGTVATGATKALSEHLLHCHHCVARAESIKSQDELTKALAANPIANMECDSLRSVISRSEHLLAVVTQSNSTLGNNESAATEDTHADRAEVVNQPDNFVPAEDTIHGTDVSAYPEVPGFEIRGTLGFGGMGVVYRARQTSLNRIVALKMIRAHALFDPESMNRFRVEAESIARLTHPNIISIYEVGEAKRLPFVALEYISGGSLAELINRTTVTSKVAAELVAKLAVAIEYAHEQGVIHRDIKPANVLLHPPRGVRLLPDNKGESSEMINAKPISHLGFEPKITDFGLARMTNLDDRYTRSGAVIGTPAYMAPEQAQGKLHETGTSADIYSLGAILYELLTGRAPFRAESPVDTLRQVIDDDPVSLRALNSDVPKDLETICIKCLQKQPDARYASAAELAADLGRYLNGQPVLARPLSGQVRLARWCRRRPAIASLIGTTALLLVTVAVSSTLFAVRLSRLNQVAVQARQNSDNDRSVAVSAITELSGALSADLERRGGTIKHRQHLIGVALAGLEQVTKSDARVAGSGIVRAHLASADLHSLSGDMESSRASLDQAQSLANELVEAFPQDEEHQYSLALVHGALADFLISSGSAENTIPEIERTTEILNRLIKQSPKNRAYLRCLLKVRLLMAVVYETLDDQEAVYRECNAYLPVAERLRAMTDGRDGREELAERHRRMQAAAILLENFEAAEEHGDAAVALFAGLKDEAPLDDSVAAMDYWVALQSQAAFYADCGRHREATEYTDSAIAGYRELLERDRDNLVTKFRLAEGLRCKAGQSYYLYDYGRVRDASYESIDLFRELTKESPSNHRYKAFVLCATEGALDCASHAGDWQELNRLAEEAVSLYQSLDSANIDQMFDGYYGPIYEILWEAARRHLDKVVEEPSIDGTCALLCIYSYLDALRGRYELSDSIKADIARTCGQELSDQNALIAAIGQLEGRSEYWLGMSLIHESVTFGLLAGQETSEPQCSKYLKRSVAAIKRLKQEYPVVARDRLYSKSGELNWVMQSELYKREFGDR